MPRFTTTPQAEREAFGNELHRQRTESGLSQTELARALGLKSQGSVSGWEQGTVEPERAHVFQMEEIFGLEPGFLSSLLGYGPPTHVNGRKSSRVQPASVRRAVNNDDRLDKRAKDAIISLYRAFTAEPEPTSPLSHQGSPRTGWSRENPLLAA